MDYNNVTKKDVLAAFNKFRNAANELTELMDYCSDDKIHDEFCCGYPFEEDFTEIVNSINNWYLCFEEPMTRADFLKLAESHIEEVLFDDAMYPQIYHDKLINGDLNVIPQFVNDMKESDYLKDILEEADIFYHVDFTMKDITRIALEKIVLYFQLNTITEYIDLESED